MFLRSLFGYVPDVAAENHGDVFTVVLLEVIKQN